MSCIWMDPIWTATQWLTSGWCCWQVWAVSLCSRNSCWGQAMLTMSSVLLTMRAMPAKPWNDERKNQKSKQARRSLRVWWKEIEHCCLFHRNLGSLSCFFKMWTIMLICGSTSTQAGSWPLLIEMKVLKIFLSPCSDWLRQTIRLLPVSIKDS